MYYFVFRSSGPVSFGFSSLECPSTLKSIDGPNEYPLLISNSPPESINSNSSLKNELQTPHVSKNMYLFIFFRLCLNNYYNYYDLLF